MFKYLNLEKRDHKSANGKSTIKEIVGAVVFLAIMVGFCALCIVGSGYHWE